MIASHKRSIPSGFVLARHLSSWAGCDDVACYPKFPTERDAQHAPSDTRQDADESFFDSDGHLIRD